MIECLVLGGAWRPSALFAKTLSEPGLWGVGHPHRWLNGLCVQRTACARFSRRALQVQLLILRNAVILRISMRITFGGASKDAGGVVDDACQDIWSSHAGVRLAPMSLQIPARTRPWPRFGFVQDAGRSFAALLLAPLIPHTHAA